MSDDGLHRCIGCGFCLDVCPDYATRRQELASPRGRVRALILASPRRSALDEELTEPCRDCHACADVCPVQVPLDSLMHPARPSRERR